MPSTFRSKTIRPFILFFGLMLAANVNAGKKSLVVMTDYWPPYIAPQGEPLGYAAKLVRLLAYELDTSVDWQYSTFSAALYRINKEHEGLAFPFFKTLERAKTYYFSDPVFKVASQLYYNRQFSRFDSNIVLEHSITGRVNGYSYGESLDKLLKNARVYATEKDALRALINNEIQLLPMTEEVMRFMLNRYFPERKDLIKSLPQYSDQSNMYFVAAKNENGKQLINKINSAISQLAKSDQLKLPTDSLNQQASLDIAVLQPAEGHPIILGVESNKFYPPYYALPLGTKVLVLEWSTKMGAKSDSEGIYKTMVELSRVVLLNGPHAGKELYIRNMHINLIL